MFECVIISHGNLAQEFLNTIQMIAGDVGQVKTFGLKPSQSIDLFQSEIQEYLKSLDKSVIIFSDMLGGSPMMSIYKVVSELKINIGLITGMNLGMMIECLLQREHIEFHEAVKLAERTGKEGIKTILREDINAGSIS